MDTIGGTCPAQFQYLDGSTILSHVPLKCDVVTDVGIGQAKENPTSCVPCESAGEEGMVMVWGRGNGKKTAGDIAEYSCHNTAAVWVIVECIRKSKSMLQL